MVCLCHIVFYASLIFGKESRQWNQVNQVFSDFPFSVAEDEVEDFDYGEEIDHELDFADVIEGGLEQEEQTTEYEQDDLIRVERAEDTKDQTTVAFATCLKKLANLQIPKICKVGNCYSSIDVNISQVGTAMYLKWVSAILYNTELKLSEHFNFLLHYSLNQYHFSCCPL